MNIEKQKELMEEVEKDVLNLKNSALADERRENKTLPVIGEGRLDADILFIGEAPGKNEAETGKPFCGRSGQILNELMESVDLNRESVYITNIVKDRPPKNRDPLPEEIEMYVPFLDKQIEIIEPKIIATLGRFAGGYIMKHFGLEDKIEPINVSHGSIHHTKAKFGAIIVVPLYHPAASIYNQKLKETLFEDFKKIDSLLNI